MDAVILTTYTGPFPDRELRLVGLLAEHGVRCHLVRVLDAGRVNEVPPDGLTIVLPRDEGSPGGQAAHSRAFVSWVGDLRPAWVLSRGTKVALLHDLPRSPGLRRGAIVTKRYMTTADALLRKRDYLGLLAISNRHREAVARIMQRTLDFVTQHPEATFAEAREIAETEGTRQAAALNQRITYLADIGTIAPMLGLFGTVLGMIKSFSVVASDIVASRPIMLAEGVSEALVTTATGLVIGIPAMAAYAFFRGRVQSLIAELEAASTQLIALMAVAFTRK